MRRPSSSADGRRVRAAAAAAFALATLFAVRDDGAAFLAWTPGGVRVAAAAAERTAVASVYDGSGGAIVFFLEANILRAQRFDPSGARLWGDGGAVVASQGAPAEVRVIGDGAGGAIATWQDHRNPGGIGQIAVQQIDSNGASLWTADGVLVSYNDYWEGAGEPVPCPDGAGGVIVAWARYRTEPNQIRVQRVDSSGAVRWATFGTIVCDDPNGTRRMAVDVIADGAGGAYVAWQDMRLSDFQVLPRVYVSRVDSSGVRAANWIERGNPAAIDADPSQWGPYLAPDGAGGVIATWIDFRAVQQQPAVWAQRYAGDGTPQWNASIGKPLLADLGGNGYPRPVTALANGSFAFAYTWGGPGIGNDTRIEVQKFDADGTPLWNGGAAVVVGEVATSSSDTQDLACAASDGTGGLVVAWTDWRAGVYNDLNADVYAQRVDADGSLATGGPEGIAVSAAAVTQEGESGAFIVGDGADGAIVTWNDDRGGTYDAFAQHVVGTAGPTPTSQFLLPTKITRKVNAKNPAKDVLTVAATLDTGPDPAAFAASASLAIGALTVPIPGLAPDKKGVWRSRSALVTFAIVPGASGSSRCTMTATINGAQVLLVGADGAVDLTLECGNVTAEGGCTLTKGSFSLGHGGLPAGASMPRSAKATLLGPGKDSFSVTWVTQPNAPPSPFPDTVFVFGPTYAKTIPGASFKRKGAVFSFTDKTNALPSMTINTATGLITVTGKKADLGTFAQGAQSVRFVAGPTDDQSVVDVRMVRKGKTLTY